MTETATTTAVLEERKTLRAGVIGLGWAGRQHMESYQGLEGVEMAALAGLEPDALDTLGTEHGVPADQRFADYRTMIAEADLDVVSIATPTALHAPIAVAALDAGCHVLSEKPMAESAASAETMVRAAKANDRALDVCYNHRRRGPVRALRKLIDGGELGRVYYVKAGWMRRSAIPGIGSWFTRSALAGGGPMMDLGIHMLDMSLHLLGEPAVSGVSASTYAEFGPLGKGGAGRPPRSGAGTAPFDVEDLSTAFLRLDDGATLLLETSWAAWMPQDRHIYLTVHGSEGGATLSWALPGPDDQTLRVWKEVDGEAVELEPELPTENHRHRQCVSEFLDVVRSGDFGAMRGEDSLRRMQVIDALYASATEGREVLLGRPVR